VRRLKNGGDRRADDVFAVLLVIGVPARRKPRDAIGLVAEKRYLEHCREPLRQRDLGDLDFGVGLAVAVELADALLGLVAENQDFLVLGLPKDGP